MSYIRHSLEPPYTVLTSPLYSLAFGPNSSMAFTTIKFLAIKLPPLLATEAFS